MAKVSARNAVILIDGYLASTDVSAYTVEAKQQILDVTGFGDGWQNFIAGLYTGKIALDTYWNSTLYAELIALGAKCVSVIPDGYALGNPAFSIYAEQENFGPGGAKDAVLKAGQIGFFTSGSDGGPLPGVALQHGAITNTLTGTAFQGLAEAASARCAGVLHVYQACATDTYEITVQHSATQGGVYADLVTFTLDGSAIGSEKIAVAAGTIQPWWRVLATRTGEAGDTLGFCVTFWHA